MDVWQTLPDIVVLLGGSALLGALFERLRQSAIIGYLVAGAVLGPNALHLIESTEEVQALSELGVALLLFAIGLEFSWPRLRSMGSIAFGGGALQILGTGFIGTLVGQLAGLSLPAAMSLGAIAALSSTASVLRLLTVRGRVTSVHGERALGILLFQDIAVVPLVIMVTVFAEGGSPTEVLWSASRTLGTALGLVLGLYVIFNWIVPRLLERGPMHSNRELALLVAVVSGLGSGAVAHLAGVSPALGAFVAGLVLAESPLAIQVRADISSLKTLLMTLFFTAIGMLSDPAWIVANFLTVAITVAGVIVVKTLIVWGVLRVFGARNRSALATGICLGQVGEFSFVLAEIARGRLLTEDVFLLVVSTAVITMMLTPYLVSSAPAHAARLFKRLPTKKHGTGEEVEEEAPVIVVGFGPAGRAASERVAELDHRVMIVDLNPKSAREAKSLGYGAVTGDACHGDVLEHAGLRGCQYIIVTAPDPATAEQIVRFVRSTSPETRIVARARFHRSIEDLRAAGAEKVVDEEHLVGVLLAAAFEEVSGGLSGEEGAELLGE